MPELEEVNLKAVSKDDPQKQIESVVKQVNEQARAISNENKTKIIKSDSGIETLTFGQLPPGGNGLLVKDSTDTPRAIFGELPNGSIALKLSQSGVDVTSATDDQLIWSSDFNLFKIVQSGTIDNIVPDPLASNTKNTVTLGHGLSFIPAVLAYVSSSNSGIIPTGQYANTPFLYPLMSMASWTGWGLWASVRTDSTTVYFDVGNYTNVGRTGMGTWTFKYYLLQETAT